VKKAVKKVGSSRKRVERRLGRTRIKGGGLSQCRTASPQGANLSPRRVSAPPLGPFSILGRPWGLAGKEDDAGALIQLEPP
jgi:hypothetical protein